MKSIILKKIYEIYEARSSNDHQRPKIRLEGCLTQVPILEKKMLAPVSMHLSLF